MPPRTRSVVAERFEGFPPDAFTFLRALRRNNRKEWFEANRDRYEQSLRTPLRLLVEEVDVGLATLAPEIVGTKRSLFRIHRDVRFSKDKSPYKTHAAVWFYHRDAGRQVGDAAVHGGAGFYFHLAPDEVFTGGGVWMPPRPALARIRDAIAEDHATLEEILRAPAFRRRFGGLETEAMLKRMPRGYDAEHPAAELLRHQSFTAGRPLAPDVVHTRKLVDVLLKDYAVMLPLVRWINAAGGLPAASAR